MACSSRLWRDARPILLASTSATRRTLLEGAGVPVEVEAPAVDERALQLSWAGAAASDVASRLAIAKARAVSSRRADRLVIGADQTLFCDGEIFSKAADRAEALRQLLRLSGRTHRLHAAVAIVHPDRPVDIVSGTADLTMRALDEATLARYVAFAGPAATRSVGGYEVEGLGIHLFERIEGEHSTILGLPMLPLLAVLRDIGVLAL